MGKLIMGMIIFQLIASVVASFMQGGGGYIAEPLEANMGASDTTIYVLTTAEFLAPSIVTIDNEQIAVSAVASPTSLTVSQRGYAGTGATPHYQLSSNNLETMVYSGSAVLANNTMQVRVVTLQNSLDSGNVLSIGGAIVGGAIGSLFLIRGHLFIAGIAGLALMGVWIAWHVYPLAAISIAIIFLIGTVLADRGGSD